MKQVSGVKNVFCKTVPGVKIVVRTVWCHRCLVQKLSRVSGVKSVCCEKCLV